MASEKSEVKKKLGGARPGAGRKAHKPTAEQRKMVESMSGFGVPFAQIAALVGVNTDTLSKYYDRELAEGKAKANSKVAQSLFQKATAGDTTAAIWWTKTQMGWKETQKHELTGEDGSPIAIAEITRKVIKST